MLSTSTTLQSIPPSGTHVFRSQAQQDLSASQNAPTPGDPALAAVEGTRKTVNDTLQKDDDLVGDIVNNLAVSQWSQTYTEVKSEAWLPFAHLKSIGVPRDILTQYEQMNPESQMGIMPEIDRAWITLNDTLYLWDYIEGQPDSYESYKKGDDIITLVGLVPVRPGVFVDAMTHAIVICRRYSIELLGVSAAAPLVTAGAPPRRDLTMYATDIFHSYAELRVWSSIVGTPEGRIFLADGGSLWEFGYNSAASIWGGSKFWLHDHSGGFLSGVLPSFAISKSGDDISSLSFDSSRRCLYALTTSIKIILFHVPDTLPKSTITRISTMGDIAMKAQHLCIGGNAALDVRTFRIIAIQAVEAAESRNIHLIALATNGVRLYFTQARSLYNQPAAAGVPAALALVHVRLPPTNLPDPLTPVQPGSNSAWAVREISQYVYKNGLVVASQQVGNQDVLLCTAPDLPLLAGLSATAPMQNQGASSVPQKPLIQDVAQLMPIDANVWAMAANPAVPEVSTSRGWNELATQFSGPPQSFLALTNSSLHLIARKRPVQVLAELFDDFGRHMDQAPLEDFLNTYGSVQMLAMALGIAAENSYIKPHEVFYSAVAVDAVLMGAGAPPVSISPSARETARRYFYEIGGHPSSVYGRGTVFSNKYQALVLYFSRLVRPIWKYKLTKGKPTEQDSNVSPAVLTSVQRDLIKLKAFLDNNPHMFLPAAPEYGSRMGAGNSDQDAWTEERNVATKLQTLLNQTIEAISFALLLIDSNMRNTVAQMAPPLQQALFNLSYEDMLTSREGRETARALVNSVINQQINQQVSVEAVSEILQQRCGSFCSPDDVMVYKAQEQVRKAKESPPGHDRAAALEQSLRFFEKGVKNMTEEKLNSICEDYRELFFSYGLITLPLKCADAWDVDGRAEAYYIEGLPQNDPRAEAYQRRLACYNCVVESLAKYRDSADAAFAAGNEPSGQQFETAWGHAFGLAMRSQDFLLHTCIYDWVVSKGNSSELIELQTPFVERYLRHEPQTRVRADLLWRFYVQNGRSMDAARTLEALAESAQFDLNLNERVEYLSLAIGNAKATSGDGLRRYDGDGEFLGDLEDKLEVATIQIEIQSLVGHLAQDQALLDNLSQRLLNITDLYSLYAEPFQLYDQQLLILHTSEHNDSGLVKSIWEAILESYQDKVDRFVALGDRVSDLGRRFYPSEIAFPVDILSEMLETYSLRYEAEIPKGWALRILVEGNVPHEAVLDYFDRIKDSGVPPFQDQGAVRHVLDDITAFLAWWLNEALRPGSRFAKAAFPAGKIEDLVEHYLSSLRGLGEDVTRRQLMDIQATVRSRF